MRRIIIVCTLAFIPFGVMAQDLVPQHSVLGPAQDNEMAITQGQTVEEEILIKGKVSLTSGKVDIRKPRSIVWRSAQVGQIVSEGYQIRTGTDGRVEIKLATSTINLKPNTTLTFSQSSVNTLTGKYKNIFECPQGKARFEIKDMALVSEFKVKTPTAIAGARGTIFYLLVTPLLTEALVEQGRLMLENMLSGQVQSLGPGFMSRSTRDGDVSDPKEIPPEYQEILNAQAWNPEGSGAQQGASGKDGGLSGDTQNQLDEQQDTTEEALTDKLSSQGVEKTQFTNAPDNDGDGIPDSIDPDDDNDWLWDTTERSIGTDPFNADTDGDDVPDAHEVWHGSSPTAADTDSSGDDDFLDAFPGTTGEDPAALDTVRQERYDRIDAITGLRQDIADLLGDAVERQKDYIIDKISDAQRGKVLIDRQGNRVRVEQYVFRPTPNEITVLNLNYRSGGAHAGISSLKWSTTFNKSLDLLKSGQIRDLAWNKYLAATDAAGVGQVDYGSSPPEYYPLSMVAELRNPPPGLSDFVFSETRNFTAPFLNGLVWSQDISHGGFLVNGAAYTLNAINWNIANPGAPPPSGSHPLGFTYVLTSGDNINCYFALIGDGAANPLDGAGIAFNNLWEFLGANINGIARNNIGTNSIEVQITSDILAVLGEEIDLIYIPSDADNMYWKPDFSWKK